MAELNRLSPPLWGLAEAARCRGDYGTARHALRARLPGLGRRHWRRLPFPVPAHRRAGPPGARRHCRRRELVGPGRRGAHRPRHPRHTARDQPRPGTGPARARRAYPQPARRWNRRARRGRPGAGSGKAPGPGWTSQQAAARARRRGEAAVLLDEARTVAAAAGATTVIDAADRLTASFDRARQAEPWYPLTAREFEVAQLVATGLTNRQIAEPASARAQDDLGTRHAHPHQAGRRTPRRDRGMVRDRPAGHPREPMSPRAHERPRIGAEPRSSSGQPEIDGARLTSPGEAADEFGIERW